MQKIPKLKMGDFDEKPMENLGKLIVGLGSILIIVGLSIWLFGDKFGWLGNLPGDIKIERPGLTIYFPIATMLILSLGLSFLIWLINAIANLAR